MATEQTPAGSSNKNKTFKQPAMVTDTSTHPALKLSGIEHLKPPGQDSNYLDWRFVIKYHFKATGVAYTLQKLEPKDRPNTWDQDNVAVCAVISRTIHAANIRYIRMYEDDALGMWQSLAKAHQDTTSGGRMYWLRKFTLAKMESEDMKTHLEEMSSRFEHLSSVVNSKNPLTLEDIYSSSLITLLPLWWSKW
jgi:hypothetical protein